MCTFIFNRTIQKSLQTIIYDPTFVNEAELISPVTSECKLIFVKG